MGFIKGLLRPLLVNRNRKAVEAFIADLESRDSMELAVILIWATHMKNLLLHDGINVEKPLECVQLYPSLLTDLYSLAQQQAQSDGDIAFGTIVWLHTIRCASFHELRWLGRNLWGTLERGADKVEPAYNMTIRASSIKPLIQGIENFPEGFSPTPQ